MRTIILSPMRREKELTKLIKDSVELNFNPTLTETYEFQLLEVQEEIKVSRDKRKEFNRKNKEEGENTY